MKQQFEAKLLGRDSVVLEVSLKGDQITSFKLVALGCLRMLKLAEKWRPKLSGSIQDVPLPPGNGHETLLLREVILKLQGKWDYPYSEEEVCHCRKVSTEIVDAWIIAGAHTPEEVGRMCTAGTQCGTCQPNTKAIIDFRLRQK